MSIKYKTGIIVILIMIVSTLAFYGVFRTILLKSFDGLDTEFAKQNMRRCMLALDREVSHLNNFTADWSSWDDTYRFIEDGNHDYVQSNLAALLSGTAISTLSISTTSKVI